MKRKTIVEVQGKMFAAFLLCLAIVLTMMPETAFAEPGSAAAKFNDKEYNTIQEAISAAGNGPATIELTRDVNENITIPKGTTITLDLKGKTLCSNEPGHTIINEGQLFLKSSTGSGTVDNIHVVKDEILGMGSALMNENYATAVLDGMITLQRSQENLVARENSAYTITNHGHMTINDGVTVTNALVPENADNGTSCVENGYYDVSPDLPMCELIINGGVFYGGRNTIKNDSGGKLVINGGNITNQTRPAIINWNICEVNGGNISAPTAFVLGKLDRDPAFYTSQPESGLLTINDGNITANKQIFSQAVIKENGNNGKSTVTIEGGKFKGLFSKLSDGVIGLATFNVKGGKFQGVPDIIDNLPEGKDFAYEDGYYVLRDAATRLSFRVSNAICGTMISGDTFDIQTPVPDVQVAEDSQIALQLDPNNPSYYHWMPDDKPWSFQTDPFKGKLEGGKDCYVVIWLNGDVELLPKDGLVLPGYYSKIEILVNGKAAKEIDGVIYATISVEHDWDNGQVTKAATVSETGIKKYTCKGCGETKIEDIAKLPPVNTPEDPSQQFGTDGTPAGPGASAAAADKAITKNVSDNDIKGARFAPLMLKSSSQGKRSIKLSWVKNNKAVKYVVYGNLCNAKGRKYKSVKLATVAGGRYNVKKIANAKLKKGKYYKFTVVALDKDDKVVSTSKTIHVATKGGKAGNYKSVTAKAKVGKKTKTVKKLSIKNGKSVKLKTTQNPASRSLKVGKHVAVRYESSNKKVATVTKSGKVKGVKKGTCYIYAYAQNGVAVKVKVKVK